jgi:CRISPR-associated endonuclease/helicase Cas3
MLFHARFAMGDRQKIETSVLQRFGKHSRENRNTILVATQVVEQSLDIDFDLVISDLSPVDLLIQRAGRLWRHPRKRPVADCALLVVSPEPSDDVGSSWPAPVLPKVNFVYGDAALLWRSAKAIFSAGKIVSRTSLGLVPVESGEVRALVEAAYGHDVPPALERAEIKASGAQSGERTQAQFNTLNLAAGYDWDGLKWERETRVKTRLAEDTITLRLARIEAGHIVPWMPIDESDLPRAWALSELNVRKSLCSGVRISSDLQNLVDRVQIGWAISEKEIPILIVRKADQDSAWKGSVLDAKGAMTNVTYSPLVGFRIASAR